MAIPDIPQKKLMAKDECCFVYCLDIRLSISQPSLERGCPEVIREVFMEFMAGSF